MASFDVAALLLPLDEAAPCGPHMEYDDAFMALDEAARGKSEQQYGDTIIPAEDPDWPEVRRLALDLFERTRDLRVAMHLLRAAVRMQGLVALHDGLSLILGLLDSHWAHVYPLLDADDGDDPTERLNALRPLTQFAAVLADVRAGRVPGDRTGVNGRLIELAAGRVQPGPDEKAPTVDSLAKVLRQGDAVEPGFLAGLVALPGVVARLDSLLDDRVGDDSPDFKPLLQLCQALAEVAGAVAGGAVPSASGAGAAAAGAAQPLAGAAVVAGAGAGEGVVYQAQPTTFVVAAPGQIVTRDDALDALKRVCEWIERNEPSNPAPLLIRRAQRLMSKSFFEIIRDLVPDGLGEIEKIAGVSADDVAES